MRISNKIFPLCDSGKGHKWKNPFGWTLPFHTNSDNKYCMHPDCVSSRSMIMIDGEPLIGKTGAVVKIHSLYEAYRLTCKKLEEQITKNKSVFEEGVEQGKEMQKALLYSTLITSRELLLETIAHLGVNEHRVAKYVFWYENQREAANCPRQDMITYKTAKNIVELTNTISEIQKAEFDVE